MTNKREIVTTFSQASIIQALGMIKCGFEQETQAFQGYQYNAFMEKYRPATIYNNLNSRAKQNLDRDLVSASTLDQLRAMTTEQIEELRNEYTKSHYSESIEVGAVVLNKVKEWLGNDNVKFERDGTVQGVELQCGDGGVTAKEFVQITKKMFKLPMGVDNECSFHIHLSIKDIRHTGGDRMCHAMQEYLLTHLNEFPLAVLKRMLHREGKWSEQYFHFGPNRAGEKYQAIAFREQGTWEFRLFGNITTASEGVRCLILATRALQHGSKCTLNRELPVADPMAHKEVIKKIALEVEKREHPENFTANGNKKRKRVVNGDNSVVIPE